MPRLLPYEPYALKLERKGRGVNSLGASLARLVEHAKVKGFTICGADLASCAIGCHPTEIWGEDFYLLGVEGQG